jgi:putative PIN family toxin of toxin-antitoxin system
MIIVLDTNVLISAMLLENSVSNQALQYAKKKGTLVFSEATKREFIDVINRDKFDRYANAQLRQQKLASILENSRMGIEASDDDINCQDADDTKFLRLAIGEQATCLIAGDKALKVLHPFKGIPIITPAKFLELSW